MLSAIPSECPITESFRTGAIPTSQRLFHSANHSILSRLNNKETTHLELNLEAVCIFAACGFFFDYDTYFKNIQALKPATEYTVDSTGKILNSRLYWQWYYVPRSISFETALDEFSQILENMIGNATKGKKVILPLSGGLDSRTLAAALPKDSDVHAFSYEFSGGPHESYYGQKIAYARNFPFSAYQVPAGYLWNKIQALAKANQC